MKTRAADVGPKPDEGRYKTSCAYGAKSFVRPIDRGGLMGDPSHHAEDKKPRHKTGARSAKPTQVALHLREPAIPTKAKPRRANDPGSGTSNFRSSMANNQPSNGLLISIDEMPDAENETRSFP